MAEGRRIKINLNVSDWRSISDLAATEVSRCRCI
jgi:hypothetical protein